MSTDCLLVMKWSLITRRCHKEQHQLLKIRILVNTKWENSSKTERETWTEKIKGTKENKKQGNVTALTHSNNKQQSNEDKGKQGLSVYKGYSSKVKTVKD